MISRGLLLLFLLLVGCLIRIGAKKGHERRDRNQSWTAIDYFPPVSGQRIRLGGAANRTFTSGNVEVYHRNKWGIVCDDDWGIKDANVACKQLGFTRGAVEFTATSYFGHGSWNDRDILMDDVDCYGQERNILSCNYNYPSNCAIEEGAGAFCKENTGCPAGWIAGDESCYFLSNVTTTKNKFAINKCAIQGGHLVNIETEAENHFLSNLFAHIPGEPIIIGGIKKRNHWMWEKVERSSFMNKGSPRRGERPKVSSRTSRQSTGSNESSTQSSIQYFKWFPGWIPGHENMEPSRVKSEKCLFLKSSYPHPDKGQGEVDVGYLFWSDDVCRRKKKRMKNGFRFLCERHREEIDFHTTFPTRSATEEPIGGTKKRNHWMWEKVERSSFRKKRSTRRGERPKVPSRTSRQSTESNETELSSVRLVGGNESNSGRVEVWYNGTWGTVCDDDFTDIAAKVVCRNLSLPFAEAYKVTNKGWSEPPTKIWLDNVICTGNECSLANCQHNGWGTNNCEHSEDVGVVCTSTAELSSVRLVGGSGSNSGRVEVFYKESWGTVCDDYFTDIAAKVVCRNLSLPFSGAYKVTVKGLSNPPTKIWLDDVICTGNESSLANCQHNSWGTHNCMHHEDVGVVCTIIELTSVRLVGGNESNSGRVEVWYNGTWGTVCDDDFTDIAAKVVCKNLNLPFAEAYKVTYNGSSEPPTKIWLDDVICTGNESSLANCQHNGWGTHNCNHKEDVGVVCSITELSSVKLVGGSESNSGRVEVWFNGTWGTVCDDDFTDIAAKLVCRNLNLPFDGAYKVTYNGWSKPPTKIWLDDVICTGNESSLANCQHNGWGTNNCRHDKDVGVVCTITELSSFRLVGGNGSNSGRVEVWYNGTWGTVCDDDFTDIAAKVVCRNLNLSFAEAYKVTYNGSSEPPTKIWLDDVICTGNESSLANCQHNGWGTHNCNHKEDVGVVCSIRTAGGIDVRLRGGTEEQEGRVEVKHLGEWGVICDDDWDNRDAAVICNMLGYKGTAIASGLAEYGSGNGNFLLDNVNCVGDEKSIADCKHHGWKVHNCEPHKVAGVNCQSQKVCSSSQYSCSNGLCLEASSVCDGICNCHPNCEDEIDDGNNCRITQLYIVNGNVTGSGRVEIIKNGLRGTVCDDDWDDNDATVVCKTFGYRYGKALRNGAYGRGTGAIWLDDVQCTGFEESILNCERRNWGVTDCSHAEDAGVICFSPDYSGQTLEIILEDGSSKNEGRVEVIYNGKRGTVCHDQWDDNDAIVVCKMLGYRYGVARIEAHYGPGSDRLTIMLDDVECTGTESSLLACTHAGWGISNCDHEKDAGVKCYETEDDMDHIDELSGFTCGLRPIESKSRKKRKEPDSQEEAVLGTYARIVGGLTASQGFYPWQVGVRKLITGGHMHVCGGTILSKHWILSAAHCFTEVTKGDILVRTGDHNNKVQDEFEQEFALEQMISHALYDKGTFNYDIALLKIKQKDGSGIKFNDHVQPACLPEQTTEYISGKYCLVSGWGRTGKSKNQKLLQYAQVPIISDQTCKPLYKNKRLTDKMFCAGYLAGGIDTCYGDSGGPLVCDINRRYTVMGATSWGGARCAAENAPGVYTRVTEFVPWIKSTIKQYS